MRTTSVTTALFALALVHFQPSAARAQVLGDNDRYAPPADASDLAAEELPPATTDSPSPSAPFQTPDLTGESDEGLDLNASGEQTPSASERALSPPAVPETFPPARRPATGAALPRQGSGMTPPAGVTSAPPAFTPRTSPKDVMAEMLSPPAGAELAGDPISLMEAMEGIYGRDRQTAVVSAYWQLTVALAKYHVAFRARPASGSEADLQEAKLEARRAQHRLANVLQWDLGRVPLPTSQPHSGSYKTRYDEIFNGRISRRAWELDQTLPLLHDLVKARAEALARGQTDAAGSANAYRFLDVVGEYNRAIAEYALLATGDSLPGRELVPLLIRIDPSEEEEHVAGSRDGLGKTSSLPQGSSGRPRRAIIDPQVLRTAGQEPTAPGERSVLTESSPERANQNVSQQPSSQRTTPRTDQWRERSTSGEFGEYHESENKL